MPAPQPLTPRRMSRTSSVAEKAGAAAETKGATVVDEKFSERDDTKVLDDAEDHAELPIRDGDARDKLKKRIPNIRTNNGCFR